jgi:anaphase-promoting complex subunit 3
VLWHLKKQVELCWLSNYVLEKWIYSPETWIVVGNCYSLQKEHETALRFFQRAIQLNPNFAYAHTLCGHEYVANEDFEQAKKCYQKALAADDKHYNAWWGLGNVFMKQEKYENAVQYFKSAVRLNERSSVLYTYLGMAYFNWSKPSHFVQARDYFNKAEELDPRNPLNRYQKASVLIAMKEDKEALNILLQLCESVPKEAPIHILIGKLYKKQMQKELALSHFHNALDLDPKNATLIKDLIEKVDNNDDRLEDNEM